MKKLLLLVALSLSILILPACQNQDNAEAVARKIENRENLDQDDYSVMLDYVINSIELKVKIMEMGGDLKDVEEIDTQYPLADRFLPVLGHESGNFDDSNMKKVDKIAELYRKAFEIDAKNHGVNLDEYDDKPNEDVPGLTDEVNHNTPTD